jgi:hypothetical protein
MEKMDMPLNTGLSNSLNKKNNIQEKGAIQKLEVLFFSPMEKAQNLIERLGSLPRAEGENNTIMLSEYDIEIADAILHAKDISTVLSGKNRDLVMAPNTRDALPWTDIVESLKKQGISYENSEPNPESRLDSIGLYFDSKGMIYAFPKMWSKQSVHKIPGTHVGVTICGEVHTIKPEEVQDIEILLNPSCETDDPFIKFRMAGLLNPDLSREDVIALYYEYDPGLKYALDEDYWRTVKIEPGDEEYYSRENREKRFNEKIDHVWDFVKNPRQDSMYVTQKLKKSFPDIKIPIIRSDYGASGVLNPGDSVDLKKVKKEQGYSQWSFEFKK